MEAVGRLGESLDNLLKDKEEGSRLYGTKLGDMHALMLVLLVRATGFQLNARSLLEFVSGDLTTAFTLVLSLLGAVSYEGISFACACFIDN